MAKITAEQIDAIINETMKVVKDRRRPVKAVRARAAKVEQTSTTSEVSSQQPIPAVVTAVEKEAAMPETTPTSAATPAPAPTPEPVPAPAAAAADTIAAAVAEPETQAAETQTAAPEPEKAPDEKPAGENPTELSANPAVNVTPEFAGYLTKAVSASWKTIGTDVLKIFSNSKRTALRSTAVETLVDKSASDLARKCAVPGALRALCWALPFERTLLLTPDNYELVVKVPSVVVSFQYTNTDDGPLLSVSWCGDVSSIAALAQYTQNEFMLDGLAPDVFAAVLGCVIKRHDNHIVKTMLQAGAFK